MDPSETTQVSHEQPELVDAVRELSAQVGSLQADVHALRSEAHSLPGDDATGHGWESPTGREGPAWIRSVDSPRRRGIAVPWLAVEIAFLVAVAVLCAVAGFDAAVIIGVMAAAWVLVAVAEWLVSRAELERQSLLYGRGTRIAPALPDDQSWFGSNGDDTMLDPTPERPPTRLPPAAE